MRQIKFRGKRIDNGEWICGSLCKVFDQCKIAMISTFETECSGYISEVDCESVGQFTGLLDKNGKEIYEGDIIEDGDLKYEVCWYDEIAAFMAEDMASQKPFLIYDLDLSRTIVVGNIHDNHELLNENNHVKLD